MTEQIRQPASIARILALGAVASGALLVIAALAAFAEPERAVRHRVSRRVHLGLRARAGGSGAAPSPTSSPAPPACTCRSGAGWPG
ncbi:hypothetical protein FPZ12_004205 [Amycolatopsis acidicola]|uniref:Uncharacterized protein n=1 Tax=Amycolatopsis acidicola TaxID=2596893 RepID=A0A5N0VKB6_9PSEU|nr:hypothetical protein FPZ12_004205 [Amycolatopsis acidicola]